MGIKYKRSIEKWIDLSGLPKVKYGNTKRIDWCRSVGYKIPFRYDNIQDNIIITDYVIENNQGCVYIVIDKYVETPVKMHTHSIIGCKLRHLLSNRIINKRPDLIQYLSNQVDAYKYNIFSSEYISVCCPVCGNTFNRRVIDLHTKGLSCHMCADTISLPNRIMYTVLKQCNINFISEVNKSNGFNWMEKYRYDFYLCIKNQHILIEMDGGFHKFKDQQERDKIKTDLAISNGFKLIRIDCMYDNIGIAFDYIKNNIIHSELFDMLPLQSVDWTDCYQKVTTKLMVQVCNLWEEENMPVFKISNTTGLSKTVVTRYLKKGKILGLCLSYNNTEARSRGNSSKAQPVCFVIDNDIKYVFKNTKEVEKLSIKYFGIQCTSSGVLSVCIGKQKSHRGLVFKFITQEQYKMIKNNNEVVLQEVA